MPGASFMAMAADFCGGNDAQTVLLLHADGTNASTTFTDSSASAHAFSVGAGSPIISTGTSKFGVSSISFPGSAYITTPDSADYAFGLGDFTIDFWLKRAAVTGAAQNVFGQANAGLTGGYHHGSLTAANLFQFAMNDDTYLPVSGAIADTNWHHIAIVRSGNNLMVALDGVFGSPVSVTGITYTDSVGTLNIGSIGPFSAPTFAGNLDEFRISKGVARWTATFAPPANPYS